MSAISIDCSSGGAIKIRSAILEGARVKNRALNDFLVPIAQLPQHRARLDIERGDNDNSLRMTFWHRDKLKDFGGVRRSI